MRPARKIRLRREGWYYLGVLAFIIGGAALRQVNLLVILAGLMVGPLVFNWRLVSATVRGLSAGRRLPRRIAAGDDLLVDLTLANGRRRLDSWVVLVEDSIVYEGAGGKTSQVRVETLFPRVPAGETGRASYRCQLPHRGRYRFGPLKISTRFPLGLVQADTTSPVYGALVVCPRLGKLGRAWDRLIESDRLGAQRSQRQRGLVEGEFYGLRDWRPGDSRRWIHWRTSARRPALTVRQFERQRNRDVTLVLDLWQPADANYEQLNNVELAVSFAATAVADLCRRGGSRLGVALAGADAAQQSATASLVFMYDVLEHLAVAAAGPAERLPGLLASVLAGSAFAARAIVISTRPPEAANLEVSREFRDERRLLAALEQSAWIDVTTAGVEKYFSWEPAS